MYIQPAKHAGPHPGLQASPVPDPHRPAPTFPLLLPASRSYDQYADAWDTSVVIDIMGEKVRFFHSIKQGVHRVWVDHPWFLAKVWGKTGSKLYGPRSGADYLVSPAPQCTRNPNPNPNACSTS